MRWDRIRWDGDGNGIGGMVLWTRSGWILGPDTLQQRAEDRPGWCVGVGYGCGCAAAIRSYSPNSAPSTQHSGEVVLSWQRGRRAATQQAAMQASKADPRPWARLHWALHRLGWAGLGFAGLDRLGSGWTGTAAGCRSVQQKCAQVQPTSHFSSWGPRLSASALLQSASAPGDKTQVSSLRRSDWRDLRPQTVLVLVLAGIGFEVGSESRIQCPESRVQNPGGGAAKSIGTTAHQQACCVMMDWPN